MHYKKLILSLSLAGLLIPGKALAENFPMIFENISGIATPSEIELASPSEIASYSNISIVPEEAEETTVMLPGAARTGFIFDHWNTEKDDSGDTYYEGDVVDLQMITDLYAFWEIDPDYVASPSEIPGEMVASPSEIEKVEEEEMTSPSEETVPEVEESAEKETAEAETTENVEETEMNEDATEESKPQSDAESGTESESESTSETETESSTESTDEKKTSETESIEEADKKTIAEKVSEKITEAVESVKEKVTSLFEKEVNDESN